MNDPDFDGLTEEEFIEWMQEKYAEELQCRCEGDYCVC